MNLIDLSAMKNFDLFLAKQTTQLIFLLDTPMEDVEIDDLINMLRAADDLYYNEQESFLSDEQYDVVRRYSEKLDPSNEYFTGIGSEVRGGKVKLPYPMGSLTQAYEGDTLKWINKYGVQSEYVACSDKLDGTSAEVLFDEKGNLQIAFSRGDGFEGADITRHISRLPNVPKNVGQKMVVRGEVIISEANFEKLKTVATRRGGSTYKNARNAVAGLMNSSENDPAVYQYIEFVAYQVIVPTVKSKGHQFDMLTECGFTIPYVTNFMGCDLTDSFLIKYLTDRRSKTVYAIDGIVMEVDAEHLRKTINPSKDTLNPEYARKFKIASDDNVAIADVVSIHWGVSKHGYLKPRIEIKPVDLVGVTITYATGFNAKFVYENKIGPGAKIRITRSGDVIPFVTDVVEPAPITNYSNWFDDRLDQIGDWQWTDTMVDAFLISDHPDIAIEKAKDLFASLEVAHLGEGNIQKLFNDGINTPVKIIQATERELVEVIGANGSKIYKSLHERLTDVPLYKLMGASGCFGRGVGTRKLKKLYEAVEGDLTKFTDMAAICAVEGFDVKTATRIIDGKEEWNQFYVDIIEYVTVAPYTKQEIVEGELTGQVYVFTGVRDKKLEEELIAKGGEIANSYSKKVTCVIAKDPNENSGKLQKARKDGAGIISLMDAWALVE